MHAGQVEALVCVRDDVSEAGRSHKPIGQRLRDDSRPLQASKRVAIALWRSGPVRHTRRDRQVDHNLRGLPQMEDDGICRIARGDEFVGAHGEPAFDAREVAAKGDGAFSQDRSVEWTHWGKVSSTRA